MTYRRGQSQPNRGGQQRGELQSQRPQPALTPEEAKGIVAEGNAELLVRKAREIGKPLSVTTSKLRRIYGEIKRIEMLWAHEGQEHRARRRAILLRPRLEYQVKRAYRDERDAMIRLNDVISDCLQHAKESRESFSNFAEFFEAIIAYAPKKEEKEQ